MSFVSFFQRLYDNMIKKNDAQLIQQSVSREMLRGVGDIGGTEHRKTLSSSRESTRLTTSIQRQVTASVGSSCKDRLEPVPVTFLPRIYARRLHNGANRSGTRQVDGALKGVLPSYVANNRPMGPKTEHREKCCCNMCLYRCSF